MTYSLLRFVHLVGVMLMGAGLIGVWLSDLRSRKVRDLALFAEAVRNIAVFYDGVVVHGAVILFMSGVWMTALHAPPPPHERGAGPGRRDAGAHPRQASTDPDLHTLPSQDYSVRREKALCVSQVQVLSEKLSGHLSSYRGSRKGNRPTEALGTEAHRGWVREPTGRNMREA